MDILSASLRYWISYKLNTDPAWEKVRFQILYSRDYLANNCQDENHHQ